MKDTKLVEFLGWYGVFAVLVAYALITFKVITANGYIYPVLNLTGAIGIFIDAFAKKDKQPAALNIIWAIIALIAIVGLAVHH